MASQEAEDTNLATQGTILLVDDDSVNRHVLGWLFRDAGFEVREAGTGAEALEMAKDRPGLVVLDVNLPDMTGFEVCRRLRADPALRTVSIIHLSAVYVKSGDRSQGLEQGADAYLVKPVEPRELMATAHALLRVRRAEEQARAAAQQWRSTFDAIGDGVCMLDAEGRVIRCNRALCGLLGRDFEEILTQRLDAVLREALAGPQADLSWLGEVLRLVPGSGTQSEEAKLGERWLRISADPIAGEAVEPGGSVVTVRDITRRKELEEQVRQGQRLESIGRLAGGLAHDFNNLHQAILGNIGLLLRGLEEGSPGHLLASTVESAAWRAAELTKQLLGFSRQTILWLRPVDPGELLRQVAHEVAPALPPAVRFDPEAGEGLWPIQADPGQLGQILRTLCLNAGESLAAGGRLRLRAANAVLDAEESSARAEGSPGEFVRFRVQDDGPGMPREFADKVFDPFFTTKPFGQGNGLGMAMVHGIAKQHQGWIECRSAPDEGTRFDLYLPRAQAAAPLAGPATVAGPSGPSGPRRVLVAEDNEILRSLAAAYLRQGGFDVLLASDGQEAVEVFRLEHSRIDLVILDQVMPQLTGRAALRQMRLIDPHVRALLASGSGGHPLDDPETAGVIRKPYRERELIQAVEAALCRT